MRLKLNKSCNKAYLNKSSLSVHYVDIHSKLEKIKCAECSTVLKNKSSLKRHLNTVHRIERLYPCTACVMKFKSKDGLKYHNRVVHLKERKLKCNQCDTTFVSKKDKKDMRMQFTLKREHGNAMSVETHMGIARNWVSITKWHI